MAENSPTWLNCRLRRAPGYRRGQPAGALQILRQCLYPARSPADPRGCPASTLDDLRRLAGRGNLLEAIRKIQEVYRVEPEEAQAAAEALKAGRMVTPSAPGMHPPDELTKALQEVQRLLSSGNKIGAIKVYRENYDVSLARAKYAVEQIEAGQTAFPEGGFLAAQPVKIETYQPAQSGKWIGPVIVLVVLLILGGNHGALLMGRGGPLTSRFYTNGPVTLIQPGDGAAPVFALGLYDPSKDTRFIGLVDGSNGKLTWRAEPLPGSGFADAIAVAGEWVYAADDTNLLAYRKSDGSLGWQAQMPDALNYGKSTLLVTPRALITANADQSIQAYDPASGSLLWTAV